MEEEEKLRRKTHDAGQSMLPDIKNQKQKSKAGGQLPPTGGKRSKKYLQQTKASHVGARVNSGLKEQQPSQERIEDSSARKGTASVQDDDRKSVISKSSIGQSQYNKP